MRATCLLDVRLHRSTSCIEGYAEVDCAEDGADVEVAGQQRLVDEQEERRREENAGIDNVEQVLAHAQAVKDIAVEWLQCHRDRRIEAENRADLHAAQVIDLFEPDWQERVEHEPTKEEHKAEKTEHPIKFLLHRYPSSHPNVIIQHDLR